MARRKYILCSDCFIDEGLRVDAFNKGDQQLGICPNCGSEVGRKLHKPEIERLAYRFFVNGTTVRPDYGGYPLVQFNHAHHGNSEINPPSWLAKDVKLLESTLKIGFFHYGPRFWMFGEIEPLKDLQNRINRPRIIKRILREYPAVTLKAGTPFYRLRICPNDPARPSEYDSPPIAFRGKGRLETKKLPVLYGSQDLDICVHECRATADDEIFVATLILSKQMKLLDLTHLLEEDVTEFESLDLAVHMLFLARSHSYEISRAISRSAKAAGFDGVIYPSYFSLLRTGGVPFETAYGLSLRRFSPRGADYARNFTIPNLAIFGRPISDGRIKVKCINKLFLTQIGYRGHFGPVQI